MKRFALGALAILIGLELALRIPPVWRAVDGAIPKGPSPVELLLKDQGGGTDKGFVRDSELGNRPVPSRREIIRTHDFEYLFEVDSDGFPNRGPWPSPADIVVLGNSLVVGQGVGIDSQFSTLLGTRLGTSRVVNLGLGGASPEHEYRIYRRYAARLHPRLVLAFVWVASDVTNAFNFSRWLASGRNQDFMAYRTTGKAKPEPGRAARALGFVRSRSRVLRALSGAGAALARARQPYLERVPRAGGDTLYLSAKTQEALALGLSRPGLPELKRVFFQPLVRLRNEIEAQGGRVLVVLIPSKEELYAAAVYPRVRRSVRETRAGLDSLGLATVDLYPPMEAAAGRGAALFFSRDIHFTVDGNRLVAEELADTIAARGVPYRWDAAP